MKTLLMGIACLLLLISCAQEELLPRTNPRFSVAFIQEIDENGVQFAANVYDFGSDDILSHGFVVDRVAVPSIHNGEVFKQQGRPEKEFSINAIHSLALGVTYYVAAFMETSSGVVYSQPLKFVSQGSEGFLLDAMDIPSPFFFGDTVVVHGRNMSGILSNYRVKFQGVLCTVFDLEKDKFKFVIPPNFTFGNEQIYSNIYNVEIQVVAKTLSLAKELEFQDPVFDEGLITYNYRDTVVISGKFFDSDNVVVRYHGDQINVLTLVSRSEREIRFLPNGRFKSLRPEIELIVRGKSHVLKDRVAINPTKILPGQSFRLLSSELFNVKGENFNIFFQDRNNLVSTVGGLSFSIVQRVEDNITYRINSNFWHSIIPRNFQALFPGNGEEGSQPVNLHLTNPFLYGWDIGPWELYWGQNRVHRAGDAVYSFSSYRIFKIDPRKKTSELVERFEKLITGFLWTEATDGRVFTAGNGGDFILFDPVTGRSQSLGVMPVEGDVLTAVATDRYLYVDSRAWKRVGLSSQWVNMAYRFDVSNGTWEVYEKNDAQFKVRRSFVYRGDIYAISQVPETLLERFDPATEMWSTVKLLNRNFSFANLAFPIIGEEVYMYLEGSQMYKLNMGTLEGQSLQNMPSMPSISLFFQAQGQLHLVSREGRVMIGEPEYFEF